MPSQPPIPPLLSPYLPCPLPYRSLTLLTSVLGASTNWLVLRFLYAVLKTQGYGENRVVFVSWLRGLEGWREGGRRMGMDFQDKSKITFIDALSSSLGLSQGGLKSVEIDIRRALELVKHINDSEASVLLVLDGIDFLLAATEGETVEVLDLVGELRESAQATLITASADLPLMQACNTSLETAHAAFVMGLAHQASVIMGVRGLDTGVARDVSGVLRITRGGGEGEAGKWGGKGGGSGGMEEVEMLYFVGGDGGVRVFERGA